MSLLDMLKTGASGAPEASQSSLISAVLSMLSSSQGGGITGLVQQFTAKGLGNVISSWIGTGENLPISTDQLQSVLGSEQVKALAAKAGISPEVAITGLTQILPQVINQLTPQGEVPKGDLLAQGMELLKGKLAS